MSHSIQHVHFATGAPGATLPPEHETELERLTAALAGQLSRAPLDLQSVRWRDRPQRYRAWIEAAWSTLVAADPGFAGGWTVDSTALPSITSPEGDRWLRMNGASFALERSDTSAVGETFLSIIDDAGLASGGQTVQLTLQNDSVDRADGAVLFIEGRRSRIDSVSAVDPPSVRCNRDPRSTDAWVATISPALGRGQRVSVAVEFHGDLPYVRSVLWVAGDGAQTLEPGAKFDGRHHSITPRALAALTTLGRTRAEELEHRTLLIQRRSTGDRLSYQEFFLDLDRDTDPGSAEARVLRQLTSYLGQRVLVRAEEAGFGQEPVFDADDLARWRSDVVDVAAQVEALVLKHFPELAVSDTARFEAAFEQFSTGALRVFDTHGAPNGVSYFSFCELAIMMVVYDERSRFWRPLIPLFARTSELFANAHHRCRGPRTVSAYGVAYNLDGARTQGPAELAANRAAWALVVNPVYSFGRIVHAALHDEVVAGPVTPFVLEDFGCGGDDATQTQRPAPLAPGALDRNWRGGKSPGPKA